MAAPIKLTPAPVQTIDLTPTWSGMVSTLILLLESGNGEGKATARAELVKMARLADERNAMARKAELDRTRARLVAAGAKFAAELAGPICDLNGERFSPAFKAWEARVAAHRDAVRDYWHARRAETIS
jgi:hypothetical protein